MVSPDFNEGKPAGWKVRIIARLAWLELFCPDPWIKWGSKKIRDPLHTSNNTSSASVITLGSV